MPRITPLLFIALFVAGCEVKTNITSPLVSGGTTDVAIAPNGRYVILWGNGPCPNFFCRIVARVYEPTGVPLSGEILVSPTTNGSYGHAQVTIDDAGEFVVVFERYVYNPSNPTLSDQVYWRQFSASGTSIGGANFVDYGQSPDISEAANGDFYISYTSPVPYGGGQNSVYVKRYAINGMLLGPRITITTITSIAPLVSQIRLQCDADFLVAWDKPTTYLQQYFAHGAPNGPSIQVGGTPSSFKESLMYRSNRSFGIVTRSNTDYYLSRFDASGDPVAPELLPIASPPVISANRCGEYALLFRDDASDTLYERLYSYSDIPISTNQVSENHPNTNPSYHIGAAGALAVGVWNRDLPERPKSNVIHRRLPMPQLLSTLGLSSGPAGSDQTICFYPRQNLGQPFCLKSAVIGPPPVHGYTYSWSPTTYLSNPNVAQPTVTHPGPYNNIFSTTYALTITGPCNCQMSDVVEVNFQPGEL